MSRRINVAAAQLGPSSEDKKEVVVRMERLMEEAADRRVDMIGFPELALTQFFPNRLDRDNDLILTVGTPGLGGGTFAMLTYVDTIPEGVHPEVDVSWPGVTPVKEHFELKQRC